MPTIYKWPFETLRPAGCFVKPVYYSRTSGKTLSGQERIYNTDGGWWEIDYKDIMVRTAEQRRLLNSYRTAARGRAGLFEIPAWSFDSSPWPTGAVLGQFLTPFDDDTPYDDGTLHSQPAMQLEAVSEAALGDTSVWVRDLLNVPSPIGIRFSYNGALYETGLPLEISGTDYRVPVFPAIRATIPAGAELEVGRPTCLVRLVSDMGLNYDHTSGGHDPLSVAWIEATDYWNDLAA